MIYRQPKRKEEILSPVWDRLIYSYDYKNEYYPAIILDAIDYKRSLNGRRNFRLKIKKK